VTLSAFLVMGDSYNNRVLSTVFGKSRDFRKWTSLGEERHLLGQLTAAMTLATTVDFNSLCPKFQQLMSNSPTPDGPDDI